MVKSAPLEESITLDDAILRFSKGNSRPAWYLSPRPSLTPPLLAVVVSSTLHIENQMISYHLLDEEVTDVATKSFLALDEEASFSLRSGWCLHANTIRRTVLR